MRNIKVTFYDNAGLGNKFCCLFKTEKALNNFVAAFQYTGGFLRFDFDIWEHNCNEKLPVITGTSSDFLMVYRALYPEIKERAVYPF